MTTKTRIHVIRDDDEESRQFDAEALMWSIDEAMIKGWLAYRPHLYEGVIMPHAIYINMSTVREIAFVTVPK
jgi:hypothetical protein